MRAVWFGDGPIPRAFQPRVKEHIERPPLLIPAVQRQVEAATEQREEVVIFVAQRGRLEEMALTACEEVNSSAHRRGVQQARPIVVLVEGDRLLWVWRKPRSLSLGREPYRPAGT